jgi:hypothetical protein
MSQSKSSGYKTRRKTTVEGQVEILGDFPGGSGGSRCGVQGAFKHTGLFLRTDSGRLVIHLGPAAYFVQHNFQIKAGDILKVTGLQVNQGSLSLVQASEVNSRGKKLKLRDKNGLPLWPAKMDRTN